MENPLFSQASMSAAAAASSSRCMRNHRITRRRTRSVSAARSAWVIGRAGRNAGGASVPASAAAGTKTPSVAEAEEPALEIAAELVLEVSRHGPLGGFPPGEPALEVLGHNSVERDDPSRGDRLERA
jgi:hypothetical protein